MPKGDKRVVGVNCHEGSVTGDLEIMRVSHEVERDQVSALAVRRGGRDQAAVTAALSAMRGVARGSGNLVPPMLAVRLTTSR